MAEHTQYTGQNIPVNTQLLMSFVMTKLNEYDEQLNNGTTIKSPYADKIQMELDNGVTIEIPPDVQNQAIQQWIISKEQPLNKQTIANGKMINSSTIQIKPSNNEKIKNKQKKSENKNAISSYLFGFIVGIIIAYIIYLLIEKYKFKNI